METLLFFLYVKDLAVTPHCCISRGLLFFLNKVVYNNNSDNIKQFVCVNLVVVCLQLLSQCLYSGGFVDILFAMFQEFCFYSISLYMSAQVLKGRKHLLLTYVLEKTDANIKSLRLCYSFMLKSYFCAMPEQFGGANIETSANEAATVNALHL